MNDISPILPKKPIFSGSNVDIEKKVLLRQEQKSMKLVIGLLYKFCKALELVLDTCTGMFAARSKSSQPPRHCRFVGNEKDCV